MKNLSVIFALASILIVSCNVFSPFQPDATTQDHLEVALKCLDANDESCAMTEYAKLPDGDDKFTGLCEIYLSQTGLTLDTLVNQFFANDTTQTALGTMAQALIPWNSSRQSSALSAIGVAGDPTQPGYCTNISDSAGDVGVLLKALGYFVDCALRMARTDQQQFTSDSDSSCSNPVSGNNDGVLTQTDILATANFSTGAIDATHPGMCVQDVQACREDILELLALSPKFGPGLAKVSNVFTHLPPDLQSAADDTVRKGVKSTVAN